jgi:hypothetical protein
MIKSYIKISEAVEILGVADKTIRRWIDADKVEGKKINGVWHVDIDSAKVLVSDKAKDKPSIALLESLLLEKDKQIREKDARILDLRDQLTEKDEQLSRKDEQVDHLTQIVAMSQKNIGALTEQLNDSRQMIEDMRSRSWWKRIFRR